MPDGLDHLGTVVSWLTSLNVQQLNRGLDAGEGGAEFVGDGRDKATLEFVEGTEPGYLLPLALVQARIADGERRLVSQGLEEGQILARDGLAFAVGDVEQAQRLVVK